MTLDDAKQIDKALHYCVEHVQDGSFWRLPMVMTRKLGYDEELAEYLTELAYESGRLNFLKNRNLKIDLKAKRFLTDGGFQKLIEHKQTKTNIQKFQSRVSALPTEKMSNRGKIHRILEYVCETEAKDIFDSDEIAKAVKLSVSEVNTLIRELEKSGDTKTIGDKERSQRGIISMVKNTSTVDAYNMKKYAEPKFNLYFDYSSPVSTASVLFNVPDKKLPLIVDAYHKGKEKFTMSGQEYWMGDRAFKIYTAEKSVNEADFWEFCDAKGLLSGGYFGKRYTPQCLELLGKDVTEDFIGDQEYGNQKASSSNAVLDIDFINQSRIEELKSLNHPDYDLIRLNKLCEEINYNYRTGNYLSVTMIGRTIMNHVPPVFGYREFKQVASQHGGSSFKNNMKNLQNSLKNIADSYLHQPIRKSETLPNATQVDFRSDLDVLLGEVVRILKL